MRTPRLMLRTHLILRYFSQEDAGDFEGANSTHATLLNFGFDLAR